MEYKCFRNVDIKIPVIGIGTKGRRHRFIITTKVNDLIASAENSLRTLGTDYIDIYQLHWPNPTIPLRKQIFFTPKQKQVF